MDAIMVSDTFQSQQIDPQKPFELIDQVRNTIRTKHYSYKTENSYVFRIKEYIYFHNKIHPIEMAEREVEEYLSWLATTRHVSSSTQNQALCALLFLYRYVLEKPLKESINAVRAKKPRRLPIVLSKKEVTSILRASHGISRLFVLLLYGCGLRLRELLDLRIKDIDFDNHLIIIRDGKGAKDRSVMLPKNSISLIKQQLEYAQSRYHEDRLRNSPGVMVPDALDRKYPDVGKEWAWFWVFPAGNYSTDPLSGIVRRHHIHEATVQKAIRNLRKRCNIVKHVTPHVFRHCFATHLLENGRDVNTVQRLMGHNHIETTMVYLHVLESCSDKVPSPADSIESLNDLPSNQLYKDSIQSEINNTEKHEMITPSVKPRITRNKVRHFTSINRMSPQIACRINHRTEYHTKKEDKTIKLKPSFFSNGVSDNDMIDKAELSCGVMKIAPSAQTKLMPYGYKNKPDKKVTKFSLSSSTINSYTSILRESGVSSSNNGEYVKWLRFYHHFCRKYKYQIESANSLQPFLKKLESKNNSNGNIIVAKKAVGLFLNLLQTTMVNNM
jgi:integron integrase